MEGLCLARHESIVDRSWRRLTAAESYGREVGWLLFEEVEDKFWSSGIITCQVDTQLRNILSN
jgi:hypothetical protein